MLERRQPNMSMLNSSVFCYLCLPLSSFMLSYLALFYLNLISIWKQLHRVGTQRCHFLLTQDKAVTLYEAHSLLNSG